MHAQGGCPHIGRIVCIERVHMLTNFTPSSRRLRTRPRSVVPGHKSSQVHSQVRAMADREVAWRALETLFGSEVRGLGSQTYQIKLNRVCGLSDRLTGSQESTYV